MLGGAHGSGCVPLEKLLTLSVPLSPLLTNEDNTGT